MLCPACRRRAARYLDERIRLMRRMIASHAAVASAEDAVHTAETYLDAFQEVRQHLVGRRLAEPGGEES